MNRPPWYRLAGHIGARNSSTTTKRRAIELTRRQERGKNRLTPAVEPVRSGSGLLFCQCDGTPGTPGTQHEEEVLHASGMKTCQYYLGALPRHR